MVRGKIEIKRIENHTSRQVTFSKRRGGFLKKANELAILCEAEIGAIIFSSSGKLYEYCSPTTSMPDLIGKYQTATDTKLGQYDHHQRIVHEVTRAREENHKLEAGIRSYLAEDLSSLTADDITHLEDQLENAINKIRHRKDQLINQQIENLQRKERLLEEENSHLRSYNVNVHNNATLHQQWLLAHKVEPGGLPLLQAQIGNFYLGESSNGGFRLEPAHPNLQEHSFLGDDLQL